MGAERTRYEDEIGETLAAALARMMRVTGMLSGLSALGYGAADVPALVEGAYAQQRLLGNAPAPGRARGPRRAVHRRHLVLVGRRRVSVVSRGLPVVGGNLRRVGPGDRVGLSFGIDCARTPGGEWFLFETDAAMLVHAHDRRDLFPYREPAVRRIAHALEALLARCCGGVV